MNDISDLIQEQVKEAFNNKTILNVCGGESKNFYGNEQLGERLDVAGHSGILSYEPSELVMTARAGTKLSEIEKLLDENKQSLPFEPPAYGENATIGGTIACNFSGPSRFYVGAARDFVLGCRIVNGKGELLRFGGEVMKNVAGYDVSRLMTGAMGTLGVLMDISFKVLPKPQHEVSLRFEMSRNEAITKLHLWRQQYLPISASCVYNNQLTIRLSGSKQSINKTLKMLGGEFIESKNPTQFWLDLKEHKNNFFNTSKDLWRLSLPSNTPLLAIDGESLYEWGGALRWFNSDEDVKAIQQIAQNNSGHATLFRSHVVGNVDKKATSRFQPLEPAILKIHKNLKYAFDPHFILNPQRMYGYVNE